MESSVGITRSMDNQKRIESAARQAVVQRNYQRVRARALVKLRQAHPEQYKALLEQEKRNDETLGKKWLDINGNTYVPGTGRTGESPSAEYSGEDYGVENEGDY